MGARHSKRSVDITTTPKKVGEDGAVIQEGEEGKLEKIAEPDLKVTTNGTLHSEIEFAVSCQFSGYASVHHVFGCIMVLLVLYHPTVSLRDLNYP